MTHPVLGLAPEDLATLLAILEKHVPKAEVWAFGSRVQGTERPFSDLDLVLVDLEPLEPQRRAELAYELSESNLPIKTDLVEWSRTSEAFRAIILRDHFVLKKKAA
jgi:predicted nucleotidyltransferase